MMGKVSLSGIVTKLTVPRPNLPAGYTELVYIQFSGSQYINTGFNPNQDTRVVADVDVQAASSDGLCVFGSRAGSKNNGFAAWVLTAKLHCDYDGNYLQTDFSPIGRYTIDFNKNVVTAGSITQNHTYTAFQSSYPIYIGHINQAGSILSANGYNGAIYSLKIYDNGTLVRDFVPCLSDAEGIGLYDLVNGVFYGNAGTGVFIGSEVA